MKKSLYTILSTVVFYGFIACKTSEKSDSPSQTSQSCVGLDSTACKVQTAQCDFNVPQNVCTLKPYLACQKLPASTCTSVAGCAVDAATSRCIFPKNCQDMEVNECNVNTQKCQYDQSSAKCFDPSLIATTACEQRPAGVCAQDGKCAVNPQTKLCVGQQNGLGSGSTTTSYPSICTQQTLSQTMCQQDQNYQKCCTWNGTACTDKKTFTPISQFPLPGDNASSQSPCSAIKSPQICGLLPFCQSTNFACIPRPGVAFTCNMVPANYCSYVPSTICMTDPQTRSCVAAYNSGSSTIGSTSTTSCETAVDAGTCLNGNGNRCAWSRAYNKCVSGSLCSVTVDVCSCLSYCTISEVGTCMVR